MRAFKPWPSTLVAPPALVVLVLLGSLALSASVAGGASAAAPWSAPGEVSSPTAYVGSPSLAFDRRGRALAVWAWYRSVDAQAGWRSSTRPPGKATVFAPQRPAPQMGLVDFPLPAAPVLFATTRALAIEQRDLGYDARCDGYRFSLGARFGRSDGVFGTADPLARVLVDTRGVDVATAADDRGDALAAWSEIPPGATGCRAPQRSGAPRRRRAVRVARRSPGTSFGAPVTLSSGQPPGAVLASVGSSGDMLVAWQRAGVLEARYRPVRGHWGPVLRVADLQSGAGPGGPLAAVTSDGRAHLVWTSGGERRPGRRVVHAASLARGAERFSAAQSIDSAPWPGAGDLERPIPTIVRLKLTPGGSRAMLAWTAWDGAHWRARVAETGRSGRFTSPVTATPPGSDYAVGDLAVRPEGRLALGLQSATGSLRWTLSVALGSAGRTFAAPEEIATGDIRGYALAADPVSSQLTVVWSELTATALPLPQLPFSVRSATRTTPG